MGLHSDIDLKYVRFQLKKCQTWNLEKQSWTRIIFYVKNNNKDETIDISD